MRIETGQGISGNSTPRARTRTARFRTLAARIVGGHDPEEKPTLYAVLPLRPQVAISS